MNTEGADPTQRKAELTSEGGDGHGDSGIPGSPGASPPKEDSKVSKTTLSDTPPAAGNGRAAQTERASGGGPARFLAETLVELKKISWPDRPQVIRETGSVIVLVCLITLAVLAFDWGVAKAIFEPLDHFARSVGGGIGSQH